MSETQKTIRCITICVMIGIVLSVLIAGANGCTERRENDYRTFQKECLEKGMKFIYSTGCI